VAVIFDNALML